MLTALDWNLTNPEEVAMEYPRNAGKVDYAFFVPESKNPVMLLEAKGVQARDIDAILEKSDDETCPRSLAGNLDSPQVGVFLTSIIDEIVYIAT